MSELDQIAGLFTGTSDKAFSGFVKRFADAGDVDNLDVLVQQWKAERAARDGGPKVGQLTVHEIEALAETHTPLEGGLQLLAFARGVERAALVKAVTLLPELQQNAPERKAGSRAFRNGMDFGLAAYCAAIKALALGVAQDQAEEPSAAPIRERHARLHVENVANVETFSAKFEKWAGPRQFDLRRRNKTYVNTVTAYAWMGWLGASLAVQTKAGKRSGDEQGAPKGAGAAERCRSTEKQQAKGE